MVWSSQTAPTPRPKATLALASRISALTGLRAHVSEWETALDHDPETGEGTAHTYPAPQGQETGWTSVSSDGTGGTLVELPVLPDDGEVFGRALERALERGASLLPRAQPAENDPPGSLYARLVAGLAETDLPPSAPLIDLTADIDIDDLDRAGIPVPPSVRTQAVLQQGRLPVAALNLDSVQRFLLAMETMPASPEMVAILATAAERLGVRLVLGEAVVAPAVRPAFPKPTAAKTGAEES
jgi:hypothetical protein